MDRIQAHHHLIFPLTGTMHGTLHDSSGESIPCQSYDVLILGAGVAGLSAAVHLADAGLRPLVLESAPRAGGRLRSFYDAHFQEHLDNGPHLMIGAYRRTLALLKRIGSHHGISAPRTVRFPLWDPERGHHALACPDMPAPWHLWAGLAALPGLKRSERLATLRLGPALLADLLADLLHDHLPGSVTPWMHHRGLAKARGTGGKALSVAQWLENHGQSRALCQRLWHPLCLATLNMPPDRADAALFVTVLRRAFLGSRYNAVPLIPRVPLHDLLAGPASSAIAARGGQVITRCRVERLMVNDGRISAVETSNGRLHLTGNKQPTRRDRQLIRRPTPEPTSRVTPVIMALPLHAARRLLPDPEKVLEESSQSGSAGDGDNHRGGGGKIARSPYRLGHLGTLKCSPIVSVHLRYDHAATLPHPLVGWPGSVGQWFFDRNLCHAGSSMAEPPGDSGRVPPGESSARNGPVSARISAVISAADVESSWSDARLTDAVHHELIRMVPDLAGKQVQHARIMREKRATLAVVPDIEPLRPSTQTPWHNLMLAGDWTQTGLPATIEGAVISGERAAREIKQRFEEPE